MPSTIVFKTALWVLLSFFTSIDTNAQKETIRFYGASGGVGVYNPIAQDAAGGLSIRLDAAVKVSEAIFSINFSKGISEQIFAEETLTELNITYGRALELGKKWLLEGHFGLGYIRQQVETASFDTETNSYVDHSVSFPIRVNFLYRLSSNLALGLNPNFNLNGVETYYSAHLILQYHLL